MPPPRGHMTVLPTLYPILTPATAWRPDASRWKPEFDPQPSNVACVYTVPRAPHAVKPLAEQNIAWRPAI